GHGHRRAGSASPHLPQRVPYRRPGCRRAERRSGRAAGRASAGEQPMSMPLYLALEQQARSKAELARHAIARRHYVIHTGHSAAEQLVRDKAESARKGIARGRSIIALEYSDGLLLMAENPSRSLRKITEVYDRIAFAGVGRYNEYDTLRKAGVRQADLMGYL